MSYKQSIHQQISADEICLRTLSIMAAEAIRVLEERVATDVESIDAATLFGMGFPAFRGGLGTYVRELGIDALQATLSQLSIRFGERFAPPQSLLGLAGQGKLIDVIAGHNSTDA